MGTFGGCSPLYLLTNSFTPWRGSIAATQRTREGGGGAHLDWLFLVTEDHTGESDTEACLFGNLERQCQGHSTHDAPSELKTRKSS